MPKQNYAVVKSGGKQYRVEKGTSLLVERISAEVGATVELEPVMVRADKIITGADELAKQKVTAKVIAHEKGPKLRIFKFKPKRGYRRRTGHRQPMTRLEISGLPGGTQAATKKSSTAKEEAKSGS